MQNNMNEILNRLRKEAEEGSAESRFKLGEMYDRGFVVPKNAAESFKWYRKAAEHGAASGVKSRGM